MVKHLGEALKDALNQYRAICFVNAEGTLMMMKFVEGEEKADSFMNELELLLGLQNSRNIIQIHDL